MKKTQFTEAHIAYALHEVEMGTPVAAICRTLGVREQTCSRWKQTFVGMGVAALRRLKQREEENRKLKQLVADLSLDTHMLQEAIRKTRSSRPRNGNWFRCCRSASRSANVAHARRSVVTAQASATRAHGPIKLP